MFIWSTEPDINYNLDWERIDKHGDNGTHSKADDQRLVKQSVILSLCWAIGEGTKKGASVKQWENGKSWAAHFSCKES